MLRVTNTFLSVFFTHLECDLCDSMEVGARVPQKITGKKPKFPTAPLPSTTTLPAPPSEPAPSTPTPPAPPSEPAPSTPTPPVPTPAKKEYRIHVKGMTQTATQDWLNEYLEMLRICVASIEWIADQSRKNRTRFAFVNVENSASFKRALILGKTLEYHDLGALRIAEAKPRGTAKNNSNDEPPSIPLPWTTEWATATLEGAEFA